MVITSCRSFNTGILGCLIGSYQWTLGAGESNTSVQGQNPLQSQVPDKQIPHCPAIGAAAFAAGALITLAFSWLTCVAQALEIAPGAQEPVAEQTTARAETVLTTTHSIIILRRTPEQSAMGAKSCQNSRAATLLNK
jgi:hypothetical protein